MGIQNFPAALQPIIQQGFLEREFHQALRSRLGYRAVADREEIAVGIGETLTKTRAGLEAQRHDAGSGRHPTPISITASTPTVWGVEQVHHHDQPLRRDHRPQHGDEPRWHRVSIPAERLRKRRAGGQKPRRARAQCVVRGLFRRQHAGSDHARGRGPNVAVDDVRGFQTTFSNGAQVPVSGANPLPVSVGLNTYNLIGATADAANISSAPGGISGVLTFWHERHRR